MPMQLDSWVDLQLLQVMFECLLLLLPVVPVDASQLLVNSKGQITEMTASLCNFEKTGQPLQHNDVESVWTAANTAFAAHPTSAVVTTTAVAAGRQEAIYNEMPGLP